jgi:hypothetical protein
MCLFSMGIRKLDQSQEITTLNINPFEIQIGRNSTKVILIKIRLN